LTSLTFSDGPLFFPVTPFVTGGAHEGSVHPELLAEHVERGMQAGPGGVFPACGTGEFHALTPAESLRAVDATIAAVAGRVPVIAGVGGSLGQARESARNLEDLGADGLLLLPPYLVGGTQEGLFQYVRAVTAATALPVIIYHRANAQFTAQTVARVLAELPSVVGVKDGVGDVALAQQMTLSGRAQREDALFFNGLLTAEASQAAYTAIGVPLYSSAIFAAQPEIATAFYRAHRDGDSVVTDRLLAEFYMPFTALRDTTAGYAVSLIKAGNRLRGFPVGGVRPPLVDPTPEHLERLENLLDHGLSLCAM